MQTRTFYALIASLPLISTSVHGENFNIKASVGVHGEVGLDESTKRLIEALPAEIRKQMLGLIQDALPLLDQSVETYLARINEILNNQIDNAKCAAMGVGKQFKDELGTIFVGQPTPIADLQKNLAATNRAFTARSHPQDYVVRYADFLQRAGVTRCQAVDPELSVAVSDMQLNVRPRFRVWQRSKRMCESASDCFAKIKANQKRIVASANVRDAKEVDAATKLDLIQEPKSPGLFESFNPTAYEEKLSELFRIEDSINIARIKRLSIAAQAWKRANDAYPKMDALYKNEYSQVNWPTNPLQDWTKAIPRCKDLVAQIQAINADAKMAAELDSSYAAKYDQLRQKLQTQYDGTFQLYEKAAAKLNAAKKALGGHPDIPSSLPKDKLD